MDISQPFTIVNKISKQDYINLIFKKSYKHPIYIIVTIVGVLMLCVAILSFMNLIPMQDSSKPPIFQLIFGIVALILPFIVKMQAGKIYDNSPRLQEDVQYTFSDSEIKCSGKDFSSSFSWNQVIKKEEIGKFILLLTGKGIGEIIDKQAFTPQQLQFVKSKV